MSGAQESRAAVFTSQPQGVEVYERGGWLPAAMLGWRHDSDGVCSAWVRVEHAGVVEDAWVELARLRLPEPPTGQPSSAAEPARSVPARSVPTPGETQQLPLPRDGGAAPAGRRVPPSGGRRRAPEPDAVATGGARVVARAPGGGVPGRHRAPADQGRHRAADTGVLTAVSSAPAGVVTSAPPLRSELPPAGPVVRGQGTRDLPTERLTRPVRLEEGVGSPRRSRRDSLSA